MDSILAFWSSVNGPTALSMRATCALARSAGDMFIWPRCAGAVAETVAVADGAIALGLAAHAIREPVATKAAAINMREFFIYPPSPAKTGPGTSLHTNYITAMLHSLAFARARRGR